jgi:hypothetical protein
MQANRLKKIQYLIGKLKISFYVGFIALAFSPLTSCIDKFDPDVNEYVNLLVINGSIIKGDSIQIVSISRTSPIDNPENIPVSGCMVKVIKENGQTFDFEETIVGTYQADIPCAELQFNSRYKLQVVSSDGNMYESDFDQLYESSPVDEVYHQNEPNQTSSNYSANGLQFYVDLKAPEGATKNYRWKMEETWEYHSPYIIYGEYSFSLSKIIVDQNPARDKQVCWLTGDVYGLYSSSTQNLTVNEKKKIPLNYVDGDDQRLLYGYSLLIKQYALSDAAYIYWNKNKVETQESGGLYQSQPSQSITNMHNITHPEETVLGFFWAASYTEARIFFKGPFSTASRLPTCVLDTFNVVEYGYTDHWLTYISSNPIVWGVADKSCFDCTLKGGTNIEPDFWE